MRLELNYSLENGEMIARISEIKIKLANIIFSQAGVNYQAEDNDRLIFLLSRFADSNFESALGAIHSEFGNYFFFSPNYLVGSKPHTWKDFAIKSAQIKKAYRNIDLLLAYPLVQGIRVFFDGFEQTDVKQLQKIWDLTDFLQVAIEKRRINPGSAEELATVRKQLAELLTLVGSPKMEIEKVENGPLDTENYSELVSNLYYVGLARLYLIQIKAPLENFDPAEELLLENFADSLASTYRGDSYLRRGVKLKPLNGKNNAGN
jgi:hypothetical protein